MNNEVSAPVMIPATKKKKVVGKATTTRRPRIQPNNNNNHNNKHKHKHQKRRNSGGNPLKRKGGVGSTQTLSNKEVPANPIHAEGQRLHESLPQAAASLPVVLDAADGDAAADAADTITSQKQQTLTSAIRRTIVSTSSSTFGAASSTKRRRVLTRPPLKRPLTTAAGKGKSNSLIRKKVVGGRIQPGRVRSVGGTAIGTSIRSTFQRDLPGTGTSTTAHNTLSLPSLLSSHQSTTAAVDSTLTSESATTIHHAGSGSSSNNDPYNELISTITTTTDIAQTDNYIPYQHYGQIDPEIRASLNIPEPKEGEKTMKDYCSKFKLPKGPPRSSAINGNSSRNSNAIHPGVPTITDPSQQPPTSLEDGGTAQAGIGGGGNSSTTAANEEDKNRSGPLVEIVNGEIVIQHSSIIVGGRQTTEEVDRQLSGHVVEEESAGITATYTSFRKNPKAQTWTIAETRRFYWALRQCGTDFSTMENFFNEEDTTATSTSVDYDMETKNEMEGDGTHHDPLNITKKKEKIRKRTRRQLKCKYSRECRKNPHLIDMAMNPKVQLPMDLSVFGELDLDAAAASLAAREKEIEKEKAVASSTAAPLPVSISPSASTIEQDLVQESMKVIEEEYRAITPNPPDASPCSQSKDNEAQAHQPKDLPLTSSEQTVSVISVLPTKKKKSQRAKFRAKPRPKSNKVKARVSKK